ncbi:MAG: hypothetical protein LBQ67_03170 [Treponema sp.]|jgi:hypothetical protein|nr:hypothetical protein [Treponema sp.]
MRVIKAGRAAVLLGVFFSLLPPAGAAEFTDGSVRLVLHEETGRFSLYSIDANSQGRHEALFADQDPRTSFLSIFFNDRIYKLGDTSAFRTRAGGNGSRPSFVFESPFLVITEEFSFIKTPGANSSNGISLRITVKNQSLQQARVGVRFLLDTDLGENSSRPPFITDKRAIGSEIFLEKGSPDGWWFSKNQQRSLMGSMFGSAENGEEPDSLYFANWKRLSDVSWKIPYRQGRNFNLPPYSVGDSAVCYYFEPRFLNREETFSFTIVLAASDERGFAAGAAGEKPEPTLARILSDSAVAAQALRSGDSASREKDLEMIRSILEQIEQYIASGSVKEDDMAAIETVLDQLRERNKLRDTPAPR